MTIEQNCFQEIMHVSKNSRAAAKGQKSVIIWFTGLSGAGKSTIARVLDEKLFLKGRHSYILDGDNIRIGLNKDLGFSDADRAENLRRVGELAKIFIDSGLIVIVAFISPFKADREAARNLVDKDEFIEVFINTPLEICEKRDPKGLYKKARNGEITNFTAIDSAYENPEHADINLDTTMHTPNELADFVIDYLNQRKII